jgi:hypothetical protein
MADRWSAKLSRPIVMRDGTKLMQAAIGAGCGKYVNQF